MKPIAHEWTSIAKRMARLNTIIKPYRAVFNKSVPIGEQYWTLCGKLTKNDKTENTHSEYNQLLRHQLITPEQFHGVEREISIHRENVTCHPELNLYYGDFFETMINSDNFNPAIINADLLHLPQEAARYMMQILYYLSKIPKTSIMVVCNLILDNPRASKKSRKGDVNLFLNEIGNHPCWEMIENVWSWEEHCYNYEGNGKKSNSNMATYWFYKK